MNIGRRGFLGLFGGAIAAAATKSYSFLGGILRPRADDVVWVPSRGILQTLNYWILYKDDGTIHTFQEDEVFVAVGQSVKGKVQAVQSIGGKIFREDVIKDLFICDGETLHVNFPLPKVTSV